jgi:hypothetical protein
MSLTSMIGSGSLLCYRIPVEVDDFLSLARARKNILILRLSCYYHMEYLWIIIRDQAELGLDGLGLGWATEQGSGCICPAYVDWGLSVAVNTSQVIDLLSQAHTCLLERKDLLLSCHGLRSFPTDCYGWLLGRRSNHRTEAGPQVLGAWSPSLDEDLDPLIGVEWWKVLMARGGE